ncbi:chaperone NapD [Pseudomonas sp. BN606]|uniref:chaperone NapD n=1 Tax=Pseudomonas sp. BN606 TaxID=2567894 RepID=UPI00245484F8|nr:chaperone NapD [Pseudomonas sp. BN606]MDH4656827.1 glutamate synthase [Pseudomonas sp. BN606]
MQDSLHIASLIVHTHPHLLSAVKANLRRIPDLELHQESPEGKLVVVLEARNEGQILTTLDAIQNLPGVLNAALVYHEILDDPEPPAFTVDGNHTGDA